MDKFQNKASCFLHAIGSAYDGATGEEESFPKLELKEEELTEDFTAMLVALSVLYKRITGDDTDLIGFTHVLNRLAIQHIMKKDKGED